MSTDSLPDALRRLAAGRPEIASILNQAAARISGLQLDLKCAAKPCPGCWNCNGEYWRDDRDEEKLRQRNEELVAEIERLRAEAEQLGYERRLLGQCRRHLDEIADPEGRYTVDAVKTAGDLAQRIVDEIGHSVTDEPALGPDFREEIVRLTAELTAVTARANKAEANRAHVMDTCHAMALRIQDLERGLDPKPLELLADARAEVQQLRKHLAAARPVLAYVSAGKRFIGVEPYPDATARRVLGAMDDESESSSKASDSPTADLAGVGSGGAMPKPAGDVSGADSGAEVRRLRTLTGHEQGAKL